MTYRYPVTLHVYTIGGGAYHSGVEVHGREWQFGEGAGIIAICPGAAEGYNGHLDPIPLGYTLMTDAQVNDAICGMIPAWNGEDYNLLHKNCCHFARRFLEELGSNTMPEWVDAWTGKVTPAVEAGFGALASRGVVLGAELVVARGVTMSAGPAAWGAAAGDLVGGGIGARVGGAVGGAKGAETGKDVGGISGSVAVGAGVGGVFGGPIGAGIGAGVGVVSWGIGKLVRTAIGEAPDAAFAFSNSRSSTLPKTCGAHLGEQQARSPTCGPNTGERPRRIGRYLTA